MERNRFTGKNVSRKTNYGILGFIKLSSSVFICIFITMVILFSAEKRKLELAEKFRELKKSGKVESYLGKKRKRTAARERKKLPNKG